MNIKNIRKKRNITQIKASELLGIKHHTYQNYENGKREPNIKTLIQLANFYKVSIDELLGINSHILNLNVLEQDKVAIIKKLINMDNKQFEKLKTIMDCLE